MYLGGFVKAKTMNAYAAAAGFFQETVIQG